MGDRVGQQLGNYRLARLLGTGGFAEVYLGEHLHLGTEAAIKVLHTRLEQVDADTFRNEARTVARLKHPHIVRVLDFGTDGLTPYLVMDYVPNGSLRTRHPRGTQLSLVTILSYIRQLADALQYAHEQRVIHRDLKPENILVDDHRALVLSDFGIATVAQSSRYQHTQDVVGTVSYMAPEQVQGKPRPASDQYSLGIIVYEWLTGTRPFTGTFTEIATQQVLTPPPSLREKRPDLSPIVEQVVMTALQKDPHQRFSNIKAFAVAFEQGCQQDQAPAPTHTDPTIDKTQLASTQKPGGLAPVMPPLQTSPSAAYIDPEFFEAQSHVTRPSTDWQNAAPISYEPPVAKPPPSSFSTTPPQGMASSKTQMQKQNNRWLWLRLVVASVAVAVIVAMGMVALPLLVSNQHAQNQQAVHSQNQQAVHFIQAIKTGHHIISIAVGTGFVGGAFGSDPNSSTGAIVGKNDTFHVGNDVVLVANLSDQIVPHITDTLSGGKVGSKGTGGISSGGSSPYYYHNWAQVLATGIYTWTLSYNGTSEASITFQVV